MPNATYCDWCKTPFLHYGDWVIIYNVRLCAGCYYCYFHGSPHLEDLDYTAPEPHEVVDERHVD